MQRVEGTLDLFEVRTFMAGQPVRVGYQRLLERLSRSYECIRTCPVLSGQRFQYRQEPLTLLGKSTQRGLKFLFEIVGILDPCARVDSLNRRVVLGKDRHNIVATPNLIARPQVGKHFVGRPLTDARGGMQLSWREPSGNFCQARRSFFQYTQYLINGEVFRCHITFPFIQTNMNAQRFALADSRWAGVDSAWEQESAEALKLSENRAAFKIEAGNLSMTLDVAPVPLWP
jgi:hypothetical protein